MTNSQSILYDVIIIGAGPTGSSAAKKLANEGYNVLIIERLKLPRHKPCSGILIKKSVDLVNTYFHENIPKSVMCLPNENKGMVFKNDNGKEYIYEQAGLNIWRDSFDHWLIERAVIAGAKLRDETTALSCQEQENYVIVKLKGKTEYCEKAKIVISCEGVTGTIKRQLTGAPKDYITTYQTFNIGSIDLDLHYFYAYLQPNLSQYDAWFNVKDEYLIFGVAVHDTNKIEHYYSKFIDYMKSEYNACINKQVKDEKWIMPRIAPEFPIDYGRGRILFAGEAAGFLNPMGEGISSGLESGYAAAGAIIQADLHNDFDIKSVYFAYKSKTSTLKYYMERQWRYVASLSNKFRHMK